MTTLVVQAHPLLDSYSGALLSAVCRGLDVSGDDYQVYRLGEAERPGASALRDVDRLILVYPTWWGGQPAVLLHWLQQTLKTPESLSTVNKVVAVTSLGSSRIINRLQGEWGRANLSERVLGACDAGATFDWLALYKIDRRPQSEIDDFLQIVEAALATRRHSALFR